MSSKSKGDRIEREIVLYLDNAGYAVMRAPSSGAATSRALPDVLAGNPHETLAIEAKYSGEREGTIYVDGSEVIALDGFSEVFGATALLAVRWSGDRTVYLFDPFSVPETPDGTLRIKREYRENCVAKLNTSETGVGRGMTSADLESRSGITRLG